MTEHTKLLNGIQDTHQPYNAVHTGTNEKPSTEDIADEGIAELVPQEKDLSSPTKNGHVPVAKQAHVPPIVPDQGWAWLILLGSFSCNVCVGGVVYSFGVFFLELLDQFQESRATTAWVGSVIAGSYAAIGPFASVMSNRFGCRATTIIGGLLTSAGFILCTFSPNIWFMILTYGLMGGIGFGFTYLTGFIMISHYFVKYRALATGIATSGSGVGTFTFAPLCTFLIEKYTWKGAMWIVAGIVLHACIMGCFYRPLTSEEPRRQGTNENQKKLFDMSLLKEPACAIVCLATLFSMTGYYIPFVFIPDLTETIGLGKAKGALLICIVGVSNTVGRVVTGILINLGWLDTLKLYVAGFLIGGVATIAVPWLKLFPLLCVFAVCFGLSFGGSVSLGTILLQEYLGVKNISSSFGFLSLFRGVATLISAPLAGLLYGWTGSHNAMFLFSGITITSAGLLSVPLRKLQLLYQAKKGPSTNSNGCYAKLPP